MYPRVRGVHALSPPPEFPWTRDTLEQGSKTKALPLCVAPSKDKRGMGRMTALHARVQHLSASSRKPLRGLLSHNGVKHGKTPPLPHLKQCQALLEGAQGDGALLLAPKGFRFFLFPKVQREGHKLDLRAFTHTVHSGPHAGLLMGLAQGGKRRFHPAWLGLRLSTCPPLLATTSSGLCQSNKRALHPHAATMSSPSRSQISHVDGLAAPHLFLP